LIFVIDGVSFVHTRWKFLYKKQDKCMFNFEMENINMNKSLLMTLLMVVSMVNAMEKPEEKMSLKEKEVLLKDMRAKIKVEKQRKRELESYLLTERIRAQDRAMEEKYANGYVNTWTHTINLEKAAAVKACSNKINELKEFSGTLESINKSMAPYIRMTALENENLPENEIN
jgi:hypothetical protein